MRVFTNTNCPFKLKYAYKNYVFLFQSILCSITFYDVPLHFNAHPCTHVSDARAIYIMQIDFAEVKVLQQQNMLNVHHMHT